MTAGRSGSPGRLIRALAATAVALGAVVGTSACAEVYTPSGQLSQLASDASAQTRTGALTLRVSGQGRLVSPSAETAISDAIDELGQDGSSLTGADVSGRLAAARRLILDALRTGEDQLIRARQLLENDAGPVAMEAVARELDATSDRLSAMEQQLQATG